MEWREKVKAAIALLPENFVVRGYGSLLLNAPASRLIYRSFEPGELKDIVLLAWSER